MYVCNVYTLQCMCVTCIIYSECMLLVLSTVYATCIFTVNVTCIIYVVCYLYYLQCIYLTCVSVRTPTLVPVGDVRRTPVDLNLASLHIQ